MAKGIKIRVMEKKDLRDAVYGAKEMFEEYGHHGDYFFFVIEDGEENIGYLIAKKEEDNKLVILQFEVAEEVSADKADYEKSAVSQLYDYVKGIKGVNGTRTIFQIS